MDKNTDNAKVFSRYANRSKVRVIAFIKFIVWIAVPVDALKQLPEMVALLTKKFSNKPTRLILEQMATQCNGNAMRFARAVVRMTDKTDKDFKKLRVFVKSLPNTFREECEEKELDPRDRNVQMDWIQRCAAELMVMLRDLFTLALLPRTPIHPEIVGALLQRIAEANAVRPIGLVSELLDSDKLTRIYDLLDALVRASAPRSEQDIKQADIVINTKDDVKLAEHLEGMGINESDNESDSDSEAEYCTQTGLKFKRKVLHESDESDSEDEDTTQTEPLNTAQAQTEPLNTAQAQTEPLNTAQAQTEPLNTAQAQTEPLNIAQTRTELLNRVDTIVMTLDPLADALTRAIANLMAVANQLSDENK